MLNPISESEGNVFLREDCKLKSKSWGLQRWLLISEVWACGRVSIWIQSNPLRSLVPAFDLIVIKFSGPLTIDVFKI